MFFHLPCILGMVGLIEQGYGHRGTTSMQVLFRGSDRRLKSIFDYGHKAVGSSQLKPYRAAVAKREFMTDATQWSYSRAAQALGFVDIAHASIKGRLERLLREDVDLDQNGKISLNEMAEYEYHVDHIGEPDGKITQQDRDLARGISDKQYLFENFHDVIARSTDDYFVKEFRDYNVGYRLRNNVFTATRPEDERQFDLAIQQTDDISGARKASSIAQNYDEILDVIAPASASKKAKLLEELWMMFSRSGNMPGVSNKTNTFDKFNTKKKVVLTQVTGEAVERWRNPNLFRVVLNERVFSTKLDNERADWRIHTDFAALKNPRKLYNRVVHMGHTRETVMTPSGYTTDGSDEDVQREFARMAQAVKMGFTKNPEGMRAFKTFFHHLPEAMKSEESLQAYLEPIHGLITKAFKLREPQHLQVLSLPDRPTLRGRYQYDGDNRREGLKIWKGQKRNEAIVSSKRTTQLNFHNWQNRWDELNRDGKNSHEAKQTLYFEIIRTLAHELTHGWQRERTDWRHPVRKPLGPVSGDGMKARVKDYRLSQWYGTNIKDGECYLGDKNTYFARPTEQDARDLGEKVANIALQMDLKYGVKPESLEIQ